MHHDNFDLWDSKHQPWNSVNIGPRRGIVEGWRAAADREGMRFGLAFHGDYALWWFQVRVPQTPARSIPALGILPPLRPQLHPPRMGSSGTAVAME